MTWPCRSARRSRCHSAIRTAPTTRRCPAMRVGEAERRAASAARRARPVRRAKPLIASARVPKPGARRRTGPVWPKPVMRDEHQPGVELRAARPEPRPQRSSVPGRKFSTRTSAGGREPHEQLGALGVRQVQGERALVAGRSPSTTARRRPCSGRGRACCRRRRGCSTLMTSAPKSPRIWQHRGPARMVETSSTRRPAKGPPSAPSLSTCPIRSDTSTSLATLRPTGSR